MGAGPDRLYTTRVFTGDAAFKRLALESGTGRVDVAMDKPDNISPIAFEFGADHEPDGISRLDTPSIRVTDDLHQNLQAAENWPFRKASMSCDPVCREFADRDRREVRRRPSGARK